MFLRPKNLSRFPAWLTWIPSLYPKCEHIYQHHGSYGLSIFIYVWLRCSMWHAGLKAWNLLDIFGYVLEGTDPEWIWWMWFLKESLTGECRQSLHGIFNSTEHQSKMVSYSLRNPAPVSSMVSNVVHPLIILWYPMISSVEIPEIPMAFGATLWGAEVAKSPAVRDRSLVGLHVEGHATRAHGQRQSPGVRAVLFGVSFSVTDEASLRPVASWLIFVRLMLMFDVCQKCWGQTSCKYLLQWSNEKMIGKHPEENPKDRRDAGLCSQAARSENGFAVGLWNWWIAEYLWL